MSDATNSTTSNDQPKIEPRCTGCNGRGWYWASDGGDLGPPAYRCKCEKCDGTGIFDDTAVTGDK